MQDENSSPIGQLDTVRKIGKEIVRSSEHASEDQIKTKRESKQGFVLPKFFKFGKSKSNQTDESAIVEQVQAHAIRSRNKIAPINPPDKQIHKNDSLKFARETLVEKNPGYRRKRNSTFTGFSRTWTLENHFSKRDIRRGSINSQAQHIKKFRELNVIKVASDDLIQDDDSALNFWDVRIKFSKLIINPYGKFSKMWKLSCFFVLLIIVIIYPVRLCFELNFDSDFSSSKRWLAFDCAIDLFCLGDLIVGFMTSYENEAHVLVTSRLAIAKNYARDYFITDLLGLFPVNPLVIHLTGVQYGLRGFNTTHYTVWRFIRLIKIVKIRKIIKNLENFLLILNINFEFINIVTFLLEIIMFIHLSACFWNLLGEVELLDSWLDVEQNRYNSVMSKYIQSIYFSLTVLLTVGYGNISGNNTNERSILVVWMFIGVIVYAYIIGSFTEIFGKLNQETTSKNEREMFYANFAKTFDLPHQVLDQVLAKIGTQYSSRNTAWIQISETNRILAELPKSLYADICAYIYRDLIEKIDFFQDKPSYFLVRILPALKPANFSYGEEVYHHGDPSNEVFFILKGRVASTCHDRFGKIRSQIFVEGSYFGERDIIYKRGRASTAFAESNVSLWKLNKNEFLTIMDECPDIKREVFILAKIKEMYRAPIVNKYESKVKEIIYAKKILTKSRTKRFDEKDNDDISSLLPLSKTGEVNPLLLSPQQSLLSPLIKKKSHSKFENLLKPTTKLQEVDNSINQSQVDSPNQSKVKIEGPSPVKSIVKRQMAKAVGRQRSLFHEDYIHLLGPRSEESIIKPLTMRWPL